MERSVSKCGSRRRTARTGERYPEQVTGSSRSGVPTACVWPLRPSSAVSAFKFCLSTRMARGCSASNSRKATMCIPHGRPTVAASYLPPAETTEVRFGGSTSPRKTSLWGRANLMAWLRVASCKVICRGNGRRLGLRKLIYSLIWQSVMWRPGKLRFHIGVKNPLPIRPTATARKHLARGHNRDHGQCGFGIVPAPPPLRDMIMRNLAVVEGMDLDALRTGINWQFQSFAEYMTMLRGRGAY